MKPIYVKGIGLWTPGHPDANSWFEKREVEDAKAPEAALLSGPMRRRASPLTRNAAEALAQAMAGAAVTPGEIASVWGSAGGENETSVALLRMMNVGEGKLSPTRFHNSVFNTAAGYASIATQNRAPSTTLCGGAEIAATCLLEAGCRLMGGESEVLLVLVDEPEPAPFGPVEGLAPLALAMVLSGDAQGALGRLSGLRLETPGSDVSEIVPTAPRFEGLYIAGALPLLECLNRGAAGRVGLEVAAAAGTPSWSVDVAPLGA